MDSSPPQKKISDGDFIPWERWLEALSETESHIRQLLDRWGVIGWISDPIAQNILYVSESCKKFLDGFEDNLSMLENAFLERVHPKDRGKVRELLLQERQGESKKLEYRLITADNEVCWLRDRSFWLQNSQGEPDRFVMAAEAIAPENSTELALKKRIEELEAQLQQTQRENENATFSLQSELENLVQRLLSIIETVNEGITVSDYEGNFAIYNQKMREITGYSGEEANSVDNFLALLYPDPSDRQLAVEGIQNILDRGGSQDLETTIRASDGTSKTLLVSTSLIEYQGKPWFLSAYRDISDRKRAEQALKLLAEREGVLRTIAYQIHETLALDEMLEAAAEAVRNFLQADRAAVYRFGPDGGGEVVAESLVAGWKSTLGWSFSHPRLDDRALAAQYQQGYARVIDNIYTADLEPALIELLECFQVRSQLIVPILRDRAPTEASPGRELWGLLAIDQCSYPRQWQPLEVSWLSQLATQLGSAIDQGERYRQLKATNQELESQATIDGLTQIANRRKFDEYIQKEWKRLAREKQPLSLILCDIDYFKRYNDTYGHQAGDRCLLAVAQCLQSMTKRAADLVARYGGEEFAIVLPNTPPSGAIYLAGEMGESVRFLNIPHPSSSVDDYVTLSLGVASMIPDATKSPDALIGAADRALYRAKAAGRDRMVMSPEGGWGMR